MSPLKFTATTKSAPHSSNDVSESFGAAREAGKGFGDVMERTLKQAGQKQLDQHNHSASQSAPQPAKPEHSHRGKAASDDKDSGASTSSSSKKQQTSDPLAAPLTLATSLHLYPLTVEVARAGSIVDGGGANIVPPTDGKVPALNLPADSKSTLTSRRQAVSGGRTGALTANLPSPVSGQGKATAVVADAADSVASKTSEKISSALSAPDKADTQTTTQATEKKEILAKIDADEKSAGVAASGDQTAPTDAISPTNDIGNSFMTSAELATKAGDAVATGEEQGQSAAISVQNATGISAAKQDMQMKKSDKKNKIAGLEKVLPETTASKAVGDNFTGRDQKPAAVAATTQHAEASANGSQNSLSLEHPIQVTAASVSNVSVTSPVVDIRARAIDRTEDILMLQTTRMSDISTESLKVTIRPGSGIELAVELHHGEKGIEASATLRNGDYHFLNSNWPDLQQRLEARGVRLSPLTCSEQFSNNNTNQFQQPQQQAGKQDEPAYAGAFADFVMAGSIAKQTAPAVSPRGWESWA